MFSHPGHGLSWILCGFLVRVLCVRPPSCSWLRDAPVYGSPGQGCTVEYESSRTFASFLRSWHSRRRRRHCRRVTGISDTEAPHHTCACTYTDPNGVCDASLGWPEVLVYQDQLFRGCLLPCPGLFSETGRSPVHATWGPSATGPFTVEQCGYAGDV